MRLFLISLLSLFFLSGCGTSTPSVTQEDYDLLYEKVNAGFKTTDDKARKAASIHGRLSPSQVRSQVREGLKDPSAAMFKSIKRKGLVTLQREPWWLSNFSRDNYERLQAFFDPTERGGATRSLVGDLWEVVVNGKNGYGAYTGYKTKYYLHVMATTSALNGTLILPKGYSDIHEVGLSIYTTPFRDRNGVHFHD